MTAKILRYAAFTVNGGGGNPAGVVLDARGLADDEMLAIAAELGYSETAFVTEPLDDAGRARVRYFAPLQEVPFCGHATVASAVALAERGAPADLVFATAAGPVEIHTEQSADGFSAELTSVPPTVAEADPASSPKRSRRCAGRLTTSTRATRQRSPTPAPGTWCSSPVRVSDWPTSTTTSSGWPV